MLLRFVSRLVSWLERVFKPVKNEVPFEVTLPLSTSSTKIETEQPVFEKAGPKFETFTKPKSILNYHKLQQK
jgi:hypothetical protein